MQAATDPSPVWRLLVPLIAFVLIGVAGIFTVCVPELQDEPGTPDAGSGTMTVTPTLDGGPNDR